MKNNHDLTKLCVLVIVLPKGKKEIVGDLLESFDVTCFLSTLAFGSNDKKLSREVMFCVIKEPLVKDAIFAIEDKYKRFRLSSSMVYSIPMDSMVGLSSYMALAHGGKK